MKHYVLKNGKTLTVREAVKEDAERIIDYMYRIAAQSDYLTFGEGELNIPLDDEKKFIEDCLKSENNLFLIAEIDRQIVGALNFRAHSRPRIRHTGEFGISVLKDYWGLGIGTILIKQLIHWAKSTGIIRKINLRVREDNHRAIKLYKSLGFVQEGIISREFLLNGKFYSTIHMGLHID